MLTLSRLMSDPDVPTVRPVIISVLLLSRILAAAAVPVASADVSDFGNPDNVNTPPDAAAADGSFSVIVASTVSIAVVPISSFPAAAPASICAVTASRRAFFTAVVYVTAILLLLYLCGTPPARRSICDYCLVVDFNCFYWASPR